MEILMPFGASGRELNPTTSRVSSEVTSSISPRILIEAIYSHGLFFCYKANEVSATRSLGILKEAISIQGGVFLSGSTLERAASEYF